MLQAWFPPLLHFWNFGASWSLSAEAFFYAVFPLALGVLLRANKRQLFAVLAVMYALCVIPGICYLLFPGSPPIYYAMPIFRLPEFIIGMTFALLLRQRVVLPSSVLAAIACIAILLIFLAWFPIRSDIYVTNNLVAVPCCAVLIYVVAQMKGGLLANRFFVLLGRSSYAFYSLQPFVLGIMYAKPPSPSAGVNFVLALLALTILSIFTYLLFEEPVRRAFTGRHITAINR